MSSRTPVVDLAVIGGGIIGLATADAFLDRDPGRSLVLLEKESQLATHQTGRNSGVIHSGIYYRPGSLKAINCRAGKRALEDFCQREGVAYEVCGKVIVAVDDSERERLRALHDRGRQNGVQCELIDQDRLREIEPHVAGVEAIHVPETGIVDYLGVCTALARRIEAAGGEIRLSSRVGTITPADDQVRLETATGPVLAKRVVNCGGLHADRIANASGLKSPARIVPFRGEYFQLKPEAEHLCKHLIYPVPDPRFPFLGVHFTRMVKGGVECGPNAVLAFAREGYSKRVISPKDLAESLSYPGFLRLATRHWKMGLGEMWRSFSKGAFVRALQRLMPAVRSEHLEAIPSGVRAQALNPDGSLVDDFLIVSDDRIVNVINAPSPAATASLNIARSILEKLPPL